ncbi:MAG: adenine phosphoribosyltransferase [Candidatus Theseobacter exili]|jgi:adenine phosphoribosyltransferase|nr:adenine phosphoribosyltransferase [Candidatus Theseobacter exili]
MNELKAAVADVPDFPKPGIIFKDITPILKEPALFRKAIDALAQDAANSKADCIAGVEARGFIFGAAIAYQLGIGFIPLRKKGKLPRKVKAVTYDLEYGTDTIEVHEEDIEEGGRIYLVDDLLATGGTIGASVQLLKKMGAVVTGIGFLIELSFLNGREKILLEDSQLPICSLITY